MYKHVVITGASGGLGQELAIYLARKSKKLTLTGRSKDALDDLRQKVLKQNNNVEVECLTLNLRRQDAQQALITSVFNNISNTPDFIILNAGLGHFGPFKDLSQEQHQEMLEINIGANTELAHQSVNHWLKNSRGQKLQNPVRLMFVASHAAFLRVPSFAVYAASKAYVLSMGLTMRQELKEFGIHVQVFCPGAMDSKFQQRSKIPKVLSSPQPCSKLVPILVNSKRGRILTTMLDRALSLASGILSPDLFDNIIFSLQRKLIKLRNRKTK